MNIIIELTFTLYIPINVSYPYNGPGSSEKIAAASNFKIPASAPG
jgi:hypothetical protein